MLQVQLGKAIDLFAGWGVRQKELSRFLEAGVVKASLSGRGKGSLRLLDERSVYDVYLAHTFHELGLSPRRIAKIVENVRPHYSAWITGKQKWLILRFRPKRAGRIGQSLSPHICRCGNNRIPYSQLRAFPVIWSSDFYPYCRRPKYGEQAILPSGEVCIAANWIQGLHPR